MAKVGYFNQIPKPFLSKLNKISKTYGMGLGVVVAINLDRNLNVLYIVFNNFEVQIACALKFVHTFCAVAGKSKTCQVPQILCGISRCFAVLVVQAAVICITDHL